MPPPVPQVIERSRELVQSSRALLKRSQALRNTSDRLVNHLKQYRKRLEDFTYHSAAAYAHHRRTDAEEQ